jgi:hypothetical protein
MVKLKKLKVSLKAAKEVLAKEEKDCPKAMRRTRALMEEDLKGEGVDHGASHGRKLSGAIKEAKQFAIAADQSLRIIRKNVTCKSHGTLHACMQMELFGGIGDLNEQGIERLHQSGKRDNIRTRSMRDTDRKFANTTREHFVDRNAKINEIKDTVRENRKRPRKEDSEGNTRPLKQQRPKEEKEIQRMETLNKFVQRGESLWNAANDQNRAEGA